MFVKRTALALSLTAAASASPALAHPGPHHEVTLAESIAHVVSSADHMMALAMAGLCGVAAVIARTIHTRTKLARAKQPARSSRS